MSKTPIGLLARGTADEIARRPRRRDEAYSGALPPPPRRYPPGATLFLKGEIDATLGLAPSARRGRLSRIVTGTGRPALQALERSGTTGAWTNVKYVAGP